MAILTRKLQVYSNGSLGEAGLFRVRWDNEIPDWGFKCRTTMENWHGPDNPPAVIEFFSIRNERDRQRVNLTKDPTWKWEETIIAMNNADGGGVQRFNYWIQANTAQFNSNGWPQMAYLTMCGNTIKVIERVPGWVRFETLKPTDWLRARSMSIVTHPWLIHSFHCVTWVQDNTLPAGGFTRHIESTGTPRGKMFYPVITWAGSAWIPERMVAPL